MPSVSSAARCVVADDGGDLGESAQRERTTTGVIAVDVVEDELGHLVHVDDLDQVLVILLDDTNQLHLNVVVSFRNRILLLLLLFCCMISS